MSVDLADLRARLSSGELALLPTDTVYGLMAALDSPRGVAALYALKGRPRSQPCQVVLYDRALLDEALVPLDPATRTIADALLPGPATCLVPDESGRFAAAAGDQPGVVGIRAPLMEGAIAALGLPLVATSANDPGGPDPSAIDEVPRRVRAGVAAVVDVGRLPGTASAVLDLREVGRGGAAVLVRPGPDPASVERVVAGLGVPWAVRDGGVPSEPDRTRAGGNAE